MKSSKTVRAIYNHSRLTDCWPAGPAAGMGGSVHPASFPLGVSVSGASALSVGSAQRHDH